ncbi:MAG: hypothetical protein COA96_07825 [SAR86 cluster bacterium]|uniref:Uncharacterized protein n=1 Tax=SAR86 cluster bacterium TaxID=2030880 RepID=A0A2A5B1H9_9GAMM|nr:MAG: hypothetical protein COA96_07825 [SAR86 cluster bacterium]
MVDERTILHVKSLAEVPGHSMTRDWALPDRENCYLVLLEMAKKHMPGRKPVAVNLDEICAKPGDWFGGDDFSGPRFDAADPKFPGMLVRDMPNPCNLPYRMVDGRRRLKKLLSRGNSAGYYFVFEYQEAEPFILDFILEPKP